jgi:L-threonylcarbamoyladenylate synthase
MLNIREAAKYLYSNKILLFETDTIIGLHGIVCPVIFEKIQILKKRNNKLFILVGKYIEHFLDYVDFSLLTDDNFMTLNFSYQNPTTFIVPAKKNSNSKLPFLNKIAIRILSKNCFASQLTEYMNQPLLSTSANISGQKPAQNEKEAFNYFGNNIIYTGHYKNYSSTPSKIIDLVTGNIIRG